MPRIVPPGGEVNWPLSEGTLGVVGVAPWATLDFCRALYRAVHACKDWQYPRVLLDINTKLPSRGRHLQLGETDPSESIEATIAELAAMGATVAVVVCNTAHIMYERWARGASIPVLNIVDETVGTTIAAGASHVAPLVSASLAEYDTYGIMLRSRGLRCFPLEQVDQRLVSELIQSVKVAGGLAAKDLRAVQSLFQRLRNFGVDTVIGGCTELSILEETCACAGMRFVDSNVALAHAALDRLSLTPGLVAHSVTR